MKKTLQFITLSLLTLLPTVTLAGDQFTLQDSITSELRSTYQGGILGLASATGDINGDGNVDIITSSLFAGDNYQNGEVYIYYGDGSAPGEISADTDVVTLSGDSAEDSAGYALAAADINNDGFDDIVVTTIKDDDAGTDAGALYIVYGQEAQLTDASLSTAVKYTGENAQDNVGYKVATGDVNGDTFQDILVSSITNDDEDTNAGAVYLIYGQAADLAGGALSSAVQFRGEAAADGLGESLATGDINGDGYDDLLLGSITNDFGGSNAGTVYVVYGQAADLAGGSVLNTIKLSGEAANDKAAVAVNTGDINNDGYDDVVIGAFQNDDAAANAGAAYVLYGSNSLFTTASLSSAVQFSGTTESELAGSSIELADVNGDGFDDILIGAIGNPEGGSLAGAEYIVLGQAGNLTSDSLTNAVKYTGEAANDNVGRNKTAGDIDGDGMADAIYSAYNSSEYGTLAGKQYIVFGEATPSGGTLADETNSITPKATYNFSMEQTHVADLNGDSYDDFIVTSSSAYSETADSGLVYIYYGSDDSITSGGVSSAPVIIEGTDSDLIGAAVASGDLNGDGYDDLVVSSNEGDNAYIIYGSASQLESHTISDDVEITDMVEATAVAVGNFDGDDYDDVLFGSSDDGTGNDAGVVYVLYGQASEYTDTSVNSLVEIDGIDNGEELGSAIAVGDVNGDSFEDMLIGARYNSSSVDEGGALYIVYGSATRITSDTDVSSAVQITGESIGDELGLAVSSADINADSFDDIVVSAYGYDGNSTNEGVFYIIYGQASDLTSSDASSYAAITGTEESEQFGLTPAAFADVNRDGTTDVIFTSQFYSTDSGALAFVLGDSENPLTSGTWIEKSFSYISAATEIELGAASAFGDFNADGYVDMFYIEDGYNTNGNPDADRTVIVYGGATEFTVAGQSSVTIECTAVYTDAGASANGYYTGDPLTVTTTNPVNTDTPGSYTVTYTAERDAVGVQASTTRTVTVADTENPTISLTGSASITVTQGDAYTESGATGTDDCDNSVSVSVSGTVNTETPGTYTRTYVATDDSGNTDSTTRTITVEEAESDEEDTNDTEEDTQDETDNSEETGEDTNDTEESSDDSTENSDDESVTVSSITALTNSRVLITYSDGTTRTIRAFARGSQKPRVKLTNDGERVVVLKRNGKNVRVFDAFTGERLKGKKIRNKSQGRAYLKLVQKNGKEYVAVVTKRGNTIRTTLMRLTPATDKLLNKNTKRMTYLKANFRVQIKNSRIRIKKRNGTVKRVYKITRRHKLKKVR